MRNLGKTFHIAAQIIGMVAQGMMDPSAKLFHWSPELEGWFHALIGVTQGVLGILAWFSDPQQPAPVDPQALPLSILKDGK